KIHLVRLRRIEHISQRAGLVLLRELVCEHGRPEELCERAEMPYVSGAPLDGSLSQNVLSCLGIVEYVGYGSAGHAECWKFLFFELAVDLSGEVPHSG